MDGLAPEKVVYIVHKIILIIKFSKAAKIITMEHLWKNVYKSSRNKQ